MTLHELIAPMSDEQRERLIGRSNWPGLQYLAVHAGAIALFGWLIGNASTLALTLALQVIQGVLIVFLFTPLHETIHRTAFATPRLNAIVARACSLLIALPATWFRCFHLTHHRYTQIAEQDPELKTAKPDTLWQYVKHLSGISLWYGQLATLLRNAANKNQDDFVPASRRTSVTQEARAMLAVYAACALGSWYMQTTILLSVWVIPALLGQPFLRAYLLAEHSDCALTGNVLDNTRTTFTNAALRRLAWNMPYHTEHHAHPAIPFHRLPEFHRIIGPSLNCTERGYLRFNKRYLAKRL